MILQTDPYPRFAVGCLLVALFAGALLATAGAGTAAPSASTGVVAPTVDAALQSPDAELNVTRVYHRTPGDQSAVDVSYVITNSEVTQRSDVHEVRLNLSNVQYSNPTGLTNVGGDTYKLTAYSGNASVRLTVPVSSQRPSERETDDYAQVVPLSIEGCQVYGNRSNPDCGDNRGVIVESDTASGTTLEPTYTYAVDGTGFVTSGNSETVSLIDAENVHEVAFYPLVVMGQYDTKSATEGGRTVTVVVPQGLELREPPQTVANSVAGAAAELDVGATQGERYLISRPDGSGFHGFAVPFGSRWATVNVDRAAHTASNTWVHEYVHTTDDTNTVDDGSMVWFHEGYASFRALQLSMDSGYGSFQRYETVLSHGRTNASGDYHDKYHSGPLLMEALDRRIQVTSNGQHDLDDVVTQLRARNDPANESEFVAIVENLSNQQTGAFLADAINPGSSQELIDWNATSAPQLPTRNSYENRRGAVPNVTTELSRIVVTDESSTRVANTSGPLAIRPNSTVRFEIQVDNTGDAAGRYKFQMKAQQDNPFDGIPAVYDQVNETVQPGQSYTVNLTRHYDQVGTTEELDLERTIPPDVWEAPESSGGGPGPGYGASPLPTHVVNVVPANATVVRSQGEHAQVDYGAPVTANTSTVVFRANVLRSYVYLPPVDVVVGYDEWEYRTGSDGVAIDESPPDYSWGRVLKVTFGVNAIEDTQYLSSLEPVVTTSIPTDLDNDSLYEDVNGDGTIGQHDVAEFYDHRNDPRIQNHAAAYDFDDDGDVDGDDVTALADEVATGNA